MRTLPGNMKETNRTADFDNNSVPAGILGRHTTAEGVWGKITVTEGSLTYRILEPKLEEHTLDPDHIGIVAPQMAHQLVIDGPIKFHIQFMQES